MAEILITNSFYRNRNLSKNFHNCVDALNIAFETYMANNLFDEDLSRIIYSSTDYALRRRAGSNTWNNANLPFMNYYMINGSIQTNRIWFYYPLLTDGIYIEELNKKLKINPVKINYEVNLWFSTFEDVLFSNLKLWNDDRLETVVPYYINIDGQQVKNIAIFYYNYNYTPQFRENDWLEKNKIHATSLNIDIDTWVITSENVDVSVPDQVILDFLATKNNIPIENEEEWDRSKQIITYFS